MRDFFEVFGTVAIALFFIFLLNTILGCTTVNIDCFREENKETTFCLDRKYRQMDHEHHGKY